ncbi:phytanoyl-CoA dioxygenase family protein [Candidatus Latescibacteria bacterium]|nr:phytanoyl-CoA dioxygenase family protein [Candidatus Latescibacterota bacterium]
MDVLAPDIAIQKRDELVELGYTLIPGVLKDPLLGELQRWSQAMFDRVPVEHKYRYQGSDIHVYTERLWRETNVEKSIRQMSDPIVEEIIDYPPQMQVCRQLQLEGLQAHDVLILLSKPPCGPPLYWHQDYTNWNSPEAATPWPTMIFFSYYMGDTTRQNGCLKVIPDSHRKRDKLHDLLPNAHTPEIQAIADLADPAFMDHPDSVDLPVLAGDLVIADARLLHATWANQTQQRRSLVLAWHQVFPFPTPPSWWDRDIPDVIKHADPGATYEATRTPSSYLQ